MTEVVSRLKPPPQPCVCGCEAIGRPRVKAWRDGLHHNRNCVCRRCKAPSYRRAAAKRERGIGKDTGGQRHLMSGALSGVDVSGPLVEIEETANVAIVRGLRRWYESKQVQRKLSRLLTHSRMSGVPWAFVASWDGKPRLVVLDYDSLRDLCQQRLDEDAS